MKLGCTLKLSEYYTHPQSFLPTALFGANSYLGYTDMGKFNLEVRKTIQDYMNYQFGDTNCNIDKTFTSTVISPYEFDPALDTSTLSTGFFIQDFKDINVQLSKNGSASNYTAPNGTLIDLEISGTGEDTNVTKPSPNGGSSGDTPSTSDSTATGKQTTYANQVLQVSQQQNFIGVLLAVIQTIFAFILVMFYILELVIFIFVLFRWIPDLVNGLLEIVKRIILGK